MTGGVKAGLIFGLVALVLTILVSFVPYIGIICCGPLFALGIGAGAGYLGLRWSATESGIGQGLIAGGLTGGGSLIGSVLFFVVILVFLAGRPEFDQILQSALDQQAQDTGFTVADLRTMVGVVGPVMGFCVGAFGLLFGLGGGALGAWLFQRQRHAAAAAVAPMPPVAP